MIYHDIFFRKVYISILHRIIMQRKVIKQGNGTLTITLPKKWTEKISLKPGSEINLDEKGNSLIISTGSSNKPKNISIDVTGMCRTMIVLLIQSLYIEGYNTISITTKDTKIKNNLRNEISSISAVIHEAISYLIGMEITSCQQGRYEIQSIAADTEEKFEVIVRRIFLLMMEEFDSFLNGARNKDKTTMKSISPQYVNITRFINYALRLLNKFGHNKTHSYFVLINFLNKINNIIKNYAGFLVNESPKMNLSKKACNIIQEVKEAFDLFYAASHPYNISKINEIQNNRDLFKRRFYQQYNNLTKNDLVVVGGFVQIYDIILDLSEFEMSLEL